MRIDDTFTTALAIASGAALGAVVRHVIVLGATLGSTSELALTFAVNIAGCFAMGLFKPGPLWGTGFLGGLTTYSAISVAAMKSHALTALIIVVLSYATAVAAWLAGDALRSRRA